MNFRRNVGERSDGEIAAGFGVPASYEYVEAAPQSPLFF